MLAPGWLTLADASGESDRPLTRTGTIGSPRAQQSRRARGDDCIARTMRKPALTKLPAVAALLLSSDLRLLVRHVSDHANGVDGTIAFTPVAPCTRRRIATAAFGRDRSAYASAVGDAVGPCIWLRSASCVRFVAGL